MKIFLSILAVLLSLALLAASVYTMINKVENSGWLLFLTFVSLYGSYEAIQKAME